MLEHDRISGSGLAALENLGEDAFTRHNAVAGGFFYRTAVVMAFFAELSDFQQDLRSDP